MADLNTIIKYIKVCRLAAEGAAGERDNAGRIRDKMEAEHPGIKEEAQRIIAAQEGGEKQSPFRNGNWEDIFSWVQQAAHVAYDFAQQAANAQYGAQLAQQVMSYTRSTRSGRWDIGLKMEEEVFWAAKQLNPTQKEMFRRMLHAQLDEQLDQMLEYHEHTW